MTISRVCYGLTKNNHQTNFMYDIFELRNMELDQLHALATELGMKSFKRMDKDKLVYAILDEAARQKAKNVPEKPAQKRGRVKKVEEKAVKKENEKSEKNTECDFVTRHHTVKSCTNHSNS